MIFRAPAGCIILSKQELERMQSLIDDGNLKQAKAYLHHCIQEITFYDDIRRKTELKNMYKEEGEEQKALQLEKDILQQVRHQQIQHNRTKELFLI